MKETLFLAIPIASTYQKMLRLTKLVVQKQETIPPNFKGFNTLRNLTRIFAADFV